MSAEPPNGKLGVVARVIEMVSSMTLTNALVVILLLLTIGPAYLTWKIINDDELLTIFLSSFEERDMPGSDCTMRVASMRGGRPAYSILLAFGTSGNDRWYLGVSTPIMPNETDSANYCRVLTEIIEYGRDPFNTPSPVYPYSKRHIFPPIHTNPHDEVR